MTDFNTTFQKAFRQRFLLIWVSLFGLADSIWLLVLHLRYGKLGGVCAISEHISCEALTFKEYSTWFNIPVPVFSLTMFFLLVLFTLINWKKKENPDPSLDVFTWLLSTVALSSVLWMSYVSFFVLQRLCVFCFILYLIIISHWILSTMVICSSYASFSDVVKKEVFHIYKNKWMWLTIFVFLAVFFSTKLIFREQVSLSHAKLTFQGDQIKTWGNPNAKVTIVIFSDFQCPACRHAAQVFHEIETNYGSKIKIIYKFFPLDPTCNPGAPYGRHDKACNAARTALCAGQQNQFWRFHDLLFDSQPDWTDHTFFDLAEQNLNMDQFLACFKSDEATKEIQKDTKEGIDSKIQATPTIFINGKQYQGHLETPAISAMIDSELKG